MPLDDSNFTWHGTIKGTQVWTNMCVLPCNYLVVSALSLHISQHDQIQGSYWHTFTNHVRYISVPRHICLYKVHPYLMGIWNTRRERDPPICLGQISSPRLCTQYGMSILAVSISAHENGALPVLLRVNGIA